MRSNYLYCLFITALLTGCGGFHGSAQAPVEERGEAISKSVPAPPSVAPTPVPATTATPGGRRASPEAAEMLFQALASLGVDYRYGGSSPATGFDCSGLVAHVFREAWGVALPRNTRGQSQAGQPIAQEELEPGDLVFYNTLNRPYSHVGIYIGDGRFIHAPRTGAAVRTESLRSAYWSKRWNGARRIATAL